MKLLAYIKQDFPDSNWPSIFMKYVGSKGLQAVILFRISSFFNAHNHPHIADMIRNISIKKTGADIGSSAVIGSGFSIGHPVGIVISGAAVIGKNCFLLSGVVIGSKSNKEGGGDILIGNDVYLGTGAKIVGKGLRIGNHTTIGANCVVLHDVPDNCTCVGIPGRIIKK